jgi:hypothetical protein
MRRTIGIVSIGLVWRCFWLAGVTIALAALNYGLVACVGVRRQNLPLRTIHTELWIGGFALLCLVACALLARQCVFRLRDKCWEAQVENRAHEWSRRSEIAASTERRFASGRQSVAVVPVVPMGMNSAVNFPVNRRLEYPVYWPELSLLVIARDRNCCSNCGCTENLHVHHIVPLTVGGTNEMGNLYTLCRKCHERLHVHVCEN